MNAKMRGQKQVEQFVKERLVLNETGIPNMKFTDPLTKNKALTFGNVYDTSI